MRSYCVVLRVVLRIREHGVVYLVELIFSLRFQKRDMKENLEIVRQKGKMQGKKVSPYCLLCCQRLLDCGSRF